MSNIHPAAYVHPGAYLGSAVSIGPFAVVEDGVRIGDRCQIAAHAVIKRGTTLGPDNSVGESSVLGGRPQHLRAPEEVGKLVMGRGNTIREHCTIHVGLNPEDVTTVGDENLIMVNAHIAHDCHVGSRTILANNVLLAGHIEVGDCAYLSGAVAIHQFCRVGGYAMVGGQAHIKADIPPFVTVDGKSSLIVGLNQIGLRRHGFSSETILQLKQAYRHLYRSGRPFSQVVEEMSARFPDGPAAEFTSFLRGGRRGFVQERQMSRRAGLSVVRPVEEQDADSSADQAVRKAG